MTAFRYVAINAAGELVRGRMEGPDEAAILAQLRRQGHVPARVEAATARSSLGALLRTELGARRGLTRQEVTNVTRELAIMLESGLDMDRSLRFLVETAPNRRVGSVLDGIRQAVRDGSALAAALARHGRSFPRLYVGMVRAGEAGGMLAETLGRLATLLERERSLAATVQSAMIYPALLLVVAIGSVVLLLTEVLPQFLPLFAETGATLPHSTRMLIAAGAFVSRYGILAVLLLAVLFLAGRRALGVPRVRLVVDRWLLRLPLAGALAREVVAARFTRTLGTLVLNGVPLIAALAIVRETVGNLAAAAAIDRAAAAAQGGAGLAAPLGESGIFPLRTVYLLRLGEETAQLGATALRAAEIHEERTRLAVQRLVSLLVPAITVAMGVVVAWIVSSLLLAMLSLNDLAH